MAAHQIKRFGRNTQGRDFAVGDIHGCFSRLAGALVDIGFDAEHDRLFGVGDLIDRGPESTLCRHWLAEPWFHAVRGNHEQMLIEVMSGMCDPNLHIKNGGAWILGMPRQELREIAGALADLPLAIEVQTARGAVGIVHADVPQGWTWPMIARALEGREPAGPFRHGEVGQEFVAYLQWSRRRIEDRDESGVAGIRAVIVGHTPQRDGPQTLGNVINIDTGAYMGVGGTGNGGAYRFTILDLETLEPAKAQS